jgi:hypothetical protein
MRFQVQKPITKYVKIKCKQWTSRFKNQDVGHWDGEGYYKNDNQHQGLAIQKLMDLLRIRYVKHILVEFMYLLEHHVSNDNCFFLMHRKE